MSPEEIQAIAAGLTVERAGWYGLSAFIGGLITGAGAYWAEKGKNRATKEDIAQITREVERVRDEFNRGIEDLKAHHQLRMVAAERRLQAHQEAYTHWKKLVSALHTREEGNITKQIMIADQWFQDNCLYLGSKSRIAMNETLHAAWSQSRIESGNNIDELISNIAKVDQFSHILFAEIDLPPMSTQEMKDLASPL